MLKWKFTLSIFLISCVWTSAVAVAQQNFNEAAPELEAQVRALQNKIKNDSTIRKLIKTDRALNALYLQTLNHLQHVSWSFRVRDNTYTHALVVQAPFPRRPTQIAIQKAEEFLKIVNSPLPEKANSIPRNAELEARLLQQQKDLVKKVTFDSLTTYEDMRNRLIEGGVNAPFEELSPVVLQLEHTILSKTEIVELCNQNPYLNRFRETALAYLKNVRAPANGKPWQYLNTLGAIQRGSEFLDVFERAFDPARSPKLYHNARYAYYNHFLLNEIPDHIVLPTISGLGATDILRARGVPIGFIGINMDIEWVDGFYQTTDEFRGHDANHVRRMWQFFKEEAERRGMTILEFARFSDHFVKTRLMPMISIKKTETDEAQNMKRLKKILLFEVDHEDALAATPEIIKRAVLRPPNLITPFEMIEGDEVVYVMEPGATTLAYTYRKLAHDFYDIPGARVDNIVAPAYRTRDNIVTVAQELLNDLDMTVDPALLHYYVSTDQGFPADFKRTIENDIKARPGETTPLDEEVPPSGSDVRERIADTFHSYWQENSGYLDRWKPAQAVFIDGRGINDDFTIETGEQLNAYFLDRKIPEEYQQYFQFKKNPLSGKTSLYEDIQHLANRYLAPNLQFESLKGASHAADLIESIAEKKLNFRTPDEAILWLKDSLEQMNAEWLVRNIHWAKDYPEYNRKWKDLAAGKQQNGLSLLKIALDLETKAYPDLIANTQKSLLFESIRRLELEVQKRRKSEVRLELSGARIHETWLEGTPYTDRWKPTSVRLDNGIPVLDEKTLRIYFDEKKIPEIYQSLFAFRISSVPNAPVLIEDIRNLPYLYLSDEHQQENRDAASQAIVIADRIWDQHLNFPGKPQAIRWLKSACQNIHQGVLDRNANGARDNPLYNGRWTTLPPVNQRHDLNQIRAAIEIRLKLEPEGMSNEQKKMILAAIADIDEEILPKAEMDSCNRIMGKEFIKKSEP